MTRACPLTAERFAEDAGGRLLSGDPARVLARVSIDTRTIGEGDAFLAIHGPRIDGHAFVGDALRDIQAARAAGMLPLVDSVAPAPFADTRLSTRPFWMLVDLRGSGVTGKEMQQRLDDRFGIGDAERAESAAGEIARRCRGVAV